jgi:cell pole-organizing protein PopZ
MIRANAYSDCGGINVSFDATKWAEQASEKDFIDLAACGFRGDYPSDNVVIFMAHFDDQVAKLFQFLEMVPVQPNRDTNGFECEVNQDDLKNWLEKNKPELVDKVFCTL